MKYRIERDCRIRFAAPVREHHVQIRLAPWDDAGQSLTRLDLVVEPEAQPIGCLDGFGNLSHHFAVLGGHQDLSFSLSAEVETRRSEPLELAAVAPARERAWLDESLHQAPRLWDFVLHQGALTPALPEEVKSQPVPSLRVGVPMLTQIQEACAWVLGVAEWDPHAEQSVSTLSELLDTGRGTATDLAHLLIALLRRWQVPARFVSGYLDTAGLPPVEAASARAQTLGHWVEALIPGAGWVGFDSARGKLADDTYVRVAVGRDAGDVRPMRQTYRGEGDPERIEATLSVSRID